jgi:hypothetical protein
MTDEQIALILNYQKEKRELVLRYTGIDLIPDSVAFTASKLKDIDPSKLDDFSPFSYLQNCNCIHCIVYEPHHNENNCKLCEYDRIGQNCESNGSIFTTALGRWERLKDEEREELRILGEIFLYEWKRLAR